MPILGERFYQMSNTIFCYDLKPIPLAVYSYLVCCAGQKDVLAQHEDYRPPLWLLRKRSAGRGQPVG